MSGWRNIVIKKNARLEDAISVLANGGKQIALVVDETGNLVAQSRMEMCVVDCWLVTLRPMFQK